MPKSNSIEFHTSRYVQSCLYRTVDIIITQYAENYVTGMVWTYIHGPVLNVTHLITSKTIGNISRELERQSRE